MEKDKYIHVHTIASNESYLDEIAKTDEKKIQSFLSSIY